MDYFRPLLHTGPARPEGALRIAGGWCWARYAEHLRRGAEPRVIDVGAVPDVVRSAWTAPRRPILGLAWDRPHLMGILNATPDSFSDGGRTEQEMQILASDMSDNASLLDVGGESTRPGATTIDVQTEIARTIPLITWLRSTGIRAAISIDTRKAEVAKAALDAGANLVNDVSGFSFDPDLAPLCAATDTPVCVMHAQGDPETMQDDPQYGDVLLDVYDDLAARIKNLRAQGVQHIIADPGIGFGKTEAHNLALLRGLSLFHGLGVPLLLGVSRKGFIGKIGGVKAPARRDPGSVAVALAALNQGIQVIRAHNAASHSQAIALWSACVADTGP